jgi:lysophospholipase L1-like esterase
MTASGGGPGSGGLASSGSGGRAGSSGNAGAGGAGAAGSAGSAGSGGGAGAGGGAGVVAAGVRWVGRVDLTDAQHPRFSWSGTGFVARFSGSGLSIQINDTGGGPFLFKPVVDGTPGAVISIAAGQKTATIASGLGAGMHTVELYRQTEGSQGDSQLMGITIAGGGSLAAPPNAPARFIEVVGDSITCGYGTLGTLSDSDCFPTESHWDTYEAVAGRALGADVSTIAISGQGAYRNYGGDMTNTLPMVYTRALTNDASPLWDFRTQPQAVIVNLGTNDISNGKGDPGMPFETAYAGLLTTIRSKYPSALIVCIIGPLLNGSDLTTIQGHIRNVVNARAAAGDHNVELFDQIAAQSSDKAACQYHPNPAENQIMANQIVTELRARLHWQ